MVGPILQFTQMLGRGGFLPAYLPLDRQVAGIGKFAGEAKRLEIGEWVCK